MAVMEERVLCHPVGYDDEGRLEERVGLIVRIARSFEQFTSGPVTETIEEQLRPLHDAGIGPYLRSHGTTLWCSRREGTSYPPRTMRCTTSVRSTQEYGARSCTDHRRTLYNATSSRRTPSSETDHWGVTMAAQTLFEKIWESHVVRAEPDGTTLLYIDRQLVHEVTSPQAFEGLKLSDRRPRRPGATLAVPDHNVPTTDRTLGIADPLSAKQIQTLEENCRDFGITLFGMNDIRQGVVHVIGPEQGFTLPGTTIVCGDSHTSTHGAFGALAFGIGTSEVEHVLATQCLVQKRPKTMRITYSGELGAGVTPKDLILATIGRLGTGGMTGHAVEYAGPAIEALSMPGRMTLCNMTIEGGGRAGMIAPDETTFEWVRGRPGAPEDFDAALARWRQLPTD